MSLASQSLPRPDVDPTETKEWLESLDSVIKVSGAERALFLANALENDLRQRGIRSSYQPYSAYRNTIPVERQGAYPGDLAIEESITSIVRWNALAMVVRANQAYGELGGHIASYASAAEIFETRVQPFLSRQRRCGGRGSGVLSAAFGSGNLCASFS